MTQQKHLILYCCVCLNTAAAYARGLLMLATRMLAEVLPSLLLLAPAAGKELIVVTRVVLASVKYQSQEISYAEPSHRVLPPRVTTFATFLYEMS